MIFKKESDIKKLLKRCSRGNKKAQEHLYRTYYGYAMSIALRYTNSNTEAEEVCNDSFYKIFKKAETYADVENFKSWFRKVVINNAIDNYRKQTKHNHLVLVDEFYEPQSADLNMSAIDAEEIIALMQHLTPIYRMVFNLYVIEEYNHEEIAEKLNITPSTSRSNLTRAKQKLRELINDYCYGQAR